MPIFTRRLRAPYELRWHAYASANGDGAGVLHNCWSTISGNHSEVLGIDLAEELDYWTTAAALLM